MGLTEEEKLRRKNDEHVRYIANNICNKDGNKPYVFVSYKSDDWEVVLHDIVYTLVKKYHLNVYFDGDFDDHNPLWTIQFPDNMEDPLCKGVLAFIDNKYATSYATLLELMYSQAGCQDEDYNFVHKKVVPINLEQLRQISDMSDTGLGKEVFEDNTVNVHAEDEKKLFDQTFQTACNQFDIFKTSQKPYMKKDKPANEPLLPRKLCSNMVKELLKFVGANENYYQSVDSLDGIYNSIKDACGNEVFDTEITDESPKQPEIVETPVETEPAKSLMMIPPTKWCYRGKDADATIIWDGAGKFCIVLAGSRVGAESSCFAQLAAPKKLKDSLIEQHILENGTFTKDYECNKIATMINVLYGGSVSMPAEVRNGHLIPADTISEPEHLEISLDEFVGKYDGKRFTGKSFDKMELQVEGNSAYFVEKKSSAREIVWSFMMQLLKERGEEVIQLINSKIKGANPVFVKSELIDQYRLAYKLTDVKPEWAMCTNYSQYDWLVRLKKWSEIAGFDSRKIKLLFYGFSSDKLSVSPNKKNGAKPLEY